MEIFSARRYLPRRSVLCFFFVFVMFFACAFYSFVIDKNPTPAFKFIDIGGFQDGINSKPPEAIVVHDYKYQSKVVSNTESPRSLKDVTPVIASDRSKLTSALQKNSSYGKPKLVNSVHVTTKYIYLPNATSSFPVASSTSVTPSSTTVAPSQDTCHLTMEESKLILLWTSFFDYWYYLPKEHFSQCSRCRNCKVTRDRSKLLESDAVIFHARDMSVTDMPAVRLPHQRWVFYCLESPPYSDFPGLQHTQNMFNWTMTYRLDSDILATYGTVHKIRPSRPLDMLSLEWAWSNKTRSVVWMCSHCPTYGGRDEYIEELSKYIDVDIYGSCGTHICPREKTEKCLIEFAQKYKFFLAFENTICKDYVTEKFFRTLKYNIIPVVFGGANYEKFAPPGSFINALSFKSPKHLAFFLSGVGKKFKLYSSFFQWRKDYSVQMKNDKECKLCSMLHRKEYKPSSYNNLREWWVKGSHCSTWKPKR